MEATGAKTGKFGIKSKNADSADALKRHMKDHAHRVHDAR